MELYKVVLYLLAFVALSYGCDLIVNTVKDFTKRLRITPFAFSFFVMGLLTSITEIAVGINALSIHQPEIFIGSLLGGVIVIFLVVIPIMAILTKGVRVKRHLNEKNLLVTLGIISVPALFALDKTVTNVEGFIAIVLYVTLFFMIRTRPGTFKKIEHIFESERKDLRQNILLKLVLGGVLVFLTSRFIVEQTLAFSEYYHVSAFVVSLVVIAIGTTLPEITLALRSPNNKAEDIALGDFIGSAAMNTLLFGVFTLINNGEVVSEKSFTVPFLFVVLALATFYLLSHGKRQLTLKEGILMLSGYLLFVGLQFSLAT